jgi:predicted outer membrane protein
MPRRTLALALAVTLAACSGRGATAPAPGSAPAPATESAPVFVPIPDASILAIVRMANNVELAYTIIAARRATTSNVKALVRRERTSHTALNTAVERVAKQLDVELRDNDVSLLLRDQSLPRRDSLRVLSGRRFDSAYVALEVRSHRELLVAIDSVFLRSVQHPELESYLTDSLRPAVSAHLAQAERLQSTFAPRK